MDVAYRALLHSAIASRVLLPLAEFQAGNAEALYRGIMNIDWSKHFTVDRSIAIESDLVLSTLDHSHFTSLKVKDAIIDQFRERTGQRPNIDPKNPDIRLHLFIYQDLARISLDLSGQGLHRRGYRAKHAQAPLKENLAAALLWKAGWPQLAQEGAAFVDPFCGSGTLCIEAYLIASKTPPNWHREQWGFKQWLGHDESLWEQVRSEAKAQIVQKKLPIQGYDTDPEAIRQARESLDMLGLSGKLHFERAQAEDFRLPPTWKNKQGLILCNPPYGHRIGDEEGLLELHQEFGRRLQSEAIGWHLGLFTADAQYSFAIGFKTTKSNAFYNGSLECKLYQFDLLEENIYIRKKEKNFWKDHQPAEEVQSFVNRLKKNQQKLKGWLQEEEISCYRIYDKDLPEYGFAIDIYEESCLAFEYEAPEEIEPQVARQRRLDVLASLAPALDLEPEQIFYKERKSQKGSNQYERHLPKGEERVVWEDGLRFAVDLTSYLDTGIFLDSRKIRQWIGESVKGKNFLNLFSYTCTASVYAAAGGAAQIVSVDLSQTYLNWGKRNFELNNINPDHSDFIRSDVLRWLERAEPGYDVILLDPPSFSNSKKMEESLDIQEDHPQLIQQAAGLLNPGGKLYFVTNKRGLKLQMEKLWGLQITEQTHESLPRDFTQGVGAAIHQCWLIERK